MLPTTATTAAEVHMHTTPTRHQCRDCLTVTARPERCTTCAASHRRAEVFVAVVEYALIVGFFGLALLIAAALS
jgi:recombinational DNA repair protein RecR